MFLAPWPPLVPAVLRPQVSLVPFLSVSYVHHSLLRREGDDMVTSGLPSFFFSSSKKVIIPGFRTSHSGGTSKRVPYFGL